MEHIYSFHMYIDFKIAISILEIDTHIYIRCPLSLSFKSCQFVNIARYAPDARRKALNVALIGRKWSLQPDIPMIGMHDVRVRVCVHRRGRR